MKRALLRRWPTAGKDPHALVDRPLSDSRRSIAIAQPHSFLWELEGLVQRLRAASEGWR